MENHLSCSPRHAGECPDGGKFTARMSEVVANKDVAEEVFLEEGVDRRRKKLVSRWRRDDGAPAELCAHLGAVPIAVKVCRYRRRLSSDRVRLSGSLTLIHDAHKGMNAIEAPRKTRIGIELNEDLFDFIDRQTGFKPIVQVSLQRREISIRRMRCDGNNCLIRRTQRSIGSRRFAAS